MQASAVERLMRPTSHSRNHPIVRSLNYSRRHNFIRYISQHGQRRCALTLLVKPKDIAFSAFPSSLLGTVVSSLQASACYGILHSTRSGNDIGSIGEQRATTTIETWQTRLEAEMNQIHASSVSEMRVQQCSTWEWPRCSFIGRALSQGLSQGRYTANEDRPAD